MTREEAIKVLENEIKCVDRDCDIERSCGKCPYAMPTKEPILEAYNMAIKALEQEPKTGHWVEIDDEPHEVWECDNCGFIIDGSGCIEPYEYRDIYNYCPNCGAKMVEPQESEE